MQPVVYSTWVLVFHTCHWLGAIFVFLVLLMVMFRVHVLVRFMYVSSIQHQVPSTLLSSKVENSRLWIKYATAFTSSQVFRTLKIRRKRALMWRQSGARTDLGIEPNQCEIINFIVHCINWSYTMLSITNFLRSHLSYNREKPVEPTKKHHLQAFMTFLSFLVLKNPNNSFKATHTIPGICLLIVSMEIERFNAYKGRSESFMYSVENNGSVKIKKVWESATTHEPSRTVSEKYEKPFDVRFRIP